MRRLTLLTLTTLILILVALPARTSAAPPLDDEPIIHTVQPGETLFRIGLQYGLAWTTIASANNLPDTTIYAGQQLIIPLTGDADPNPNPAPTPEVILYRVQRGEILAGIALRHNTTVDAIAALNGLPNNNLIYPGQTLRIPVASPLEPAVVDQPAPTPVPPAAPVSKHIVVDISDQRMYVYENGALIWTFVASTGMAGRNTAIGSFAVQSKIPNAYGATWNIWMPNWLGIYWAGPLENGIHALPILPDGSQLWAGYLGTPISYGCVVLSMDDSATLYNWADIGTPVDIQY